jgi:methylphosphotriester-DNA--protein-cysteine methyltransferase
MEVYTRPGSRVYHLDAECSDRSPGWAAMAVDKSRAQAQGLRPCRRCGKGVDGGEGAPNG